MSRAWHVAQETPMGLPDRSMRPESITAPVEGSLMMTGCREDTEADESSRRGSEPCARRAETMIRAPSEATPPAMKGVDL